MRADGRPAGVAVASVMAVASGSVARASSNQRAELLERIVRRRALARAADRDTRDGCCGGSCPGRTGVRADGLQPQLAALHHHLQRAAI